MIDNITILPTYVANPEYPENSRKPYAMLPVAAYINSLSNIPIVRARVTGSERTKHTFLEFEGMQGIRFKCPLAHRDADLLQLEVVEVHLNPNHSCFGGRFWEFAGQCEALLSSVVFESGSVIRFDQALNLPGEFQQLRQGLVFMDRSQVRLVRSGSNVREIIMGAKSSGTQVVAYDLNRSLIRRGQPSFEMPMTRIEIRRYGKGIPAFLKRGHTLEDFARWVEGIANGTNEPFRQVKLHIVGGFPPNNEPQRSISGRNTIEYAEKWRAYCAEEVARARIGERLNLTSYSAAKSSAMQVGSGLRKTWLSSETSEHDVSGAAVSAARAFLRGVETEYAVAA